MTGRSIGGILATRRGSLLLALLCAGLAAVVLFVGLGHVKSNVSTPVPQATVLVATGQIHKGMTGVQVAAHHLYKSTPMIASQISAGALSDAGQIATATALTNVLPGQQLTTSDFGTPVAASQPVTPTVGVDQALTPNERGLEVTISGSPGAVDITQAGSRVDVYATGGIATLSASTDGSTSAAGSASTSPSSGAAAGPVLIASDVLVLKPATLTPVRIDNQLVAGSSLVLAVPDGKVKDVIADNGALYLALLPAHQNPVKNSTTDKGGSK